MNQNLNKLDKNFGIIFENDIKQNKQLIVNHYFKHLYLEKIINPYEYKRLNFVEH